MPRRSVLERILTWRRDNRVVRRLPSVSDRRAVEALFIEEDVDDPVRRTRLLRRAMGNPITYHTLPLSVESTYQMELSMYCTGAWRRMR